MTLPYFGFKQAARPEDAHFSSSLARTISFPEKGPFCPRKIHERPVSEARICSDLNDIRHSVWPDRIRRPNDGENMILDLKMLIVFLLFVVVHVPLRLIAADAPTGQVASKVLTIQP
jgi:hypothetical protein